MQPFIWCCVLAVQGVYSTIADEVDGFAPNGLNAADEHDALPPLPV